MNQETTFQAQALPAVTIELLPMRWQEVNSRGKPVGAAEVAKFGHTVAASVDGKRMLIGTEDVQRLRNDLWASRRLVRELQAKIVTLQEETEP